MTIKIAVTGASGRMGKTILENILNDREAEVSGACDMPGSGLIGKDIGEYLGREPLGQTVADSLETLIQSGTQAIIDFTAPSASVAFTRLAAAHGIPIVIGSTGMSAGEKAVIVDCAKKIPIMMAPNMSIGVNVLFRLLHEAAQLLGDGYDIELIEAHHRLKKDAPSGTAVRMAEILAKATGLSYPDDINYHREGIVGARSDREIGMQTIRGGDIVGEHTAMFCGIGERLEITHIATSRDTFAKGAIRAAKWTITQKPGLYDMQDVLGLA